MKWQKLKITGRPPTPRQNATLTAVGNRLFIFGGWDGRRQHNDIHVLDTGIIFLSSIRYFLVSYFSLCSLLVSLFSFRASIYLSSFFQTKTTHLKRTNALVQTTCDGNGAAAAKPSYLCRALCQRKDKDLFVCWMEWTGLC